MRHVLQSALCGSPVLFLFVCFVFLWVLSKVGSEVLGHKDPTHDVIVPEVLEDPVKRVAVAAPSLPRTRGRHISL